MLNSSDSKAEIVGKICRAKKGLTVNQFYKICEQYNLNEEEMYEARQIADGRGQYFDTRKLKIDLTDM